ncbi:hypothetical protein [Aquihabitans sp. McL0605]|uniref:hypothetical protein n=1 Tax=Aquihabitans sp. McL0605 TaxID=3415671 RepID=UPI003CF6E993
MSPPTDLSDGVLADRIRVACAAHVRDLVVDDRPFDPSRPRLDGVPLRAPGSGRRPPSRRDKRLLVGAAVVLLVVGAVVVTRRSSDDPQPVTVTPSVTTTVPFDGGVELPEVAAPSALSPLGLHLAAVERWIQPPSTSDRTQLFGTRTEGVKVLVSADPRLVVGVGAQTVVRGQPAWIEPAPGLGPTGTTVVWEEGGATLSAQSVGLADADLVQLLDSLTRRSADPVQGFDPPAGGEVIDLGEAGPERTPASITELTYREPEPGSKAGSVQELRIRTTTNAATAASPLQEPSVAHLQARLANASDEERDAPSVRSHSASYDRALIIGPGRADVTIEVAEGRGTEEDLAAVAIGLRWVRDDDIDELRDSLDAQLAGSHRLASDDLGAGVVELWGEPGDPAVCLLVDGIRRCSRAEEAGTMAVSALLAGHWYLGLASASGVDLTVGQASATGTAATGERLASRSKAVPSGDRTLTLVAVPDEVHEVVAGSGAGARAVPRPRS